MKTRPKGRKGEQEAREEWTERLQRFANARTVKQKQAAIEPALKINPGGALRDMLLAWGYSASARGRKPKGANANGLDKTARERLEETLDSLFGAKPSPVRSLYAKLAGRADLTVRDACRIVAALIVSWPVRLERLDALKPDEAREDAVAQAGTFLRGLLSELSSNRSYEWSASDMAVRIFRLADEERVGLRHFIKEAGEKEGALIVAGARNILIGTHPVDIIRDFHNTTNLFLKENGRGILVFVFDSALFEAGSEGFFLLSNIGMLTTAVTAFALFSDGNEYQESIREHKVNWSRWRTFCNRCCVVMRKPPVIDARSGKIASRKRVDQFVMEWQPSQHFSYLDELEGFVRFDAGHVLPRKYPIELLGSGEFSANDLYWDVVVRPQSNKPEGLGVEYFTPSLELYTDSAKAQRGSSDKSQYINMSQVRQGRLSTEFLPIEEDLNYVIRRHSPGPRYDDAQRAIYMAARGRLNLDSDEQHKKNLNAAAALREVGYEILPISIMIGLFPKMLDLPILHGIDDDQESELPKRRGKANQPDLLKK